MMEPAITPAGHALTKAELDDLQQVQFEIERRARNLADELGYEGELTVGAVEDGIRFFQKRTIETVLELGKRLLLLKELAPHGQFLQRVALLGISPGTAQRFMLATAKFCKCRESRLLTAANNHSKLLELLVMDDEELADLDAGCTVRGLTLDDVETMTVTELRAALRKERQAHYEDNEQHGRLLANKNKKIDELDKSLSVVHAKPIELRGDAAVRDLEDTARRLASQVTAEMCRKLRLVFDAMDGGYPTNTALESMVASLAKLVAAVRDAATEHGLAGHLEGYFPQASSADADVS